MGKSVVPVRDVHAAVVVVDEAAELVDDHGADLAHVVQAVEPPREALQHLQVGDRAHVLASVPTRALGGGVVEENALVLSARLRGHHRRLRAGDELARVHGVLGALGDADRECEPAGLLELLREQSLGHARREAHGIACVAGGHDDAELLAAQPADDVGAADGLAEDVGERDEHLVAGAVAVDVVDALEVVDVEHEHGNRVMRAADPVQLGPEAVVEVAVVVEAGERVRLRLEFEPRPDLGVVEGEGSRVAEALRELELLLGEDRIVAQAIDVERALDRAARDERDGDEGLGLVGRSPGDDLHARVEMGVVDTLGLAVLDDPAGDSLAVERLVAHDLVRPFVSRHERDEAPGGSRRPGRS